MELAIALWFSSILFFVVAAVFYAVAFVAIGVPIIALLAGIQWIGTKTGLFSLPRVPPPSPPKALDIFDEYLANVKIYESSSLAALDRHRRTS